jgi:hypothetical protein
MTERGAVIDRFMFPGAFPGDGNASSETGKNTKYFLNRYFRQKYWL